MGSNNFGEEPKPAITKEEVMEELSESTPVQEPAHEETEEEEESASDLLAKLIASQGEGDALGIVGGRIQFGTPIPEIKEELKRQIIIQEEWSKKYKDEDINATAREIAIDLGLYDPNEEN